MISAGSPRKKTEGLNLINQYFILQTRHLVRKPHTYRHLPGSSRSSRALHEKCYFNHNPSNIYDCMTYINNISIPCVQAAPDYQDHQ